MPYFYHVATGAALVETLRKRNDGNAGMSEPSDDAGRNVHRIAVRGTGSDPARTLAWLRTVATQQRLRWRFFDPSFAVDPAWDMLIELAIARLEGRTVNATQLSQRIVGANQRWISLLVDLGYCEIGSDATSPGAIALTALGWDEMNRYVSAASGAPETNRA